MKSFRYIWDNKTCENKRIKEDWKKGLRWKTKI